MVSKQKENTNILNIDLVIEGLPGGQKFVIRRKMEGCTGKEIYKALSDYKKELGYIIGCLEPQESKKKKKKPASRLGG